MEGLDVFMGHGSPIEGGSNYLTALIVLLGLGGIFYKLRARK